jgi:hypothetical protein
MRDRIVEMKEIRSAEYVDMGVAVFMFAYAWNRSSQNCGA